MNMRMSTLKVKIITYFSVLLLLSMLFFFMLFLGVSQYEMKRLSIEYSLQILDSAKSRMDQYFAELETIGALIAHDETVIKAADYRMKAPVIDYGIELYNQRDVAEAFRRFDAMSYINSAVIVSPEGSALYSYDKSFVMGYDFTKEAWYKEAIASPRYFKYTGMHVNDYLLATPENTVSLIIPIFDPARYSIADPCYLLIDFSVSSLMNMKDEHVVELGLYYKGVWIAQPSNIASRPEITEILKNEGEYGGTNPAVSRKGDYMILKSRSGKTAWDVIAIVSMENLTRAVSLNRIMAFLILFPILGLCILFVVKLSKEISRPVMRLSDDFMRIGKGQELSLDTQTGIKELDIMAKTADEMLKSMHRLSEDLRYKDNIIHREQLKALQHQINPHFLNNILHTMKALALENDSKGLSMMITQLGRMLAYSVYEPYETVRFEEEIEYVRGYIKLQERRYSMVIAFSVDVGEEAASLPMPKLALQPIVENAIEYGLLPLGGGNIDITASEDGNEMIITLSNSGKTICEEQLALINRELAGSDVSSYEKKSSIGLVNVNARLSAFYNKGFEMHVLSQNDRYTSIVFVIPAWREYAKRCEE